MPCDVICLLHYPLMNFRSLQTIPSERKCRPPIFACHTMQHTVATTRESANKTLSSPTEGKQPIGAKTATYASANIDAWIGTVKKRRRRGGRNSTQHLTQCYQFQTRSRISNDGTQTYVGRKPQQTRQLKRPPLFSGQTHPSSHVHKRFYGLFSHSPLLSSCLTFACWKAFHPNVHCIIHIITIMSFATLPH